MYSAAGHGNTLTWGSVSVCQGCHNKTPKTGWLKTTGWLIILHFGGYKSEIKVLAGSCSLWQTERGNPSFHLLALDVCQQCLAFLGFSMHYSMHMAIFSLCVFSLCSLYVRLFLCSNFPFLKGHQSY